MTEDVAPNEPFAFKQIDLSANTILKTFSGEVQFVFPFGGQAPEGDVKLVGSWGTGPTVNEVDVGFSNFSIPIPDTPDMVWTSAAVGVKNMFVDKAPITFSGSLGFAFGPQLNSQYIANVTFSGSGSTQQLTAGYDLTMVPFAFANSIGNFGLGDLSSFQSLFPLLKSTGTVTANFARVVSRTSHSTAQRACWAASSPRRRKFRPIQLWILPPWDRRRSISATPSSATFSIRPCSRR